MVGQGVLRECLADPRVDQVLSIVRAPTPTQHPKLREIAHDNFVDFSPLIPELTGYDATFYCLGVSSVGLTEAAYRRVTYDITIAAAEPLAAANPEMTFIFVSGSGADSTEHSSVMWARVKGAAENAVKRLPFKAVYIFRPGIIQPGRGIYSRTASYNVIYAVIAPIMPLLLRFIPKYVTTTELIGKAMINLAAHGSTMQILRSEAIGVIARQSPQ